MSEIQATLPSYGSVFINDASKKAKRKSPYKFLEAQRDSVVYIESVVLHRW